MIYTTITIINLKTKMQHSTKHKHIQITVKNWILNVLYMPFRQCISPSNYIVINMS